MKRLTEQEIKERRIECTKKWEEKYKQKIKEYNHEYYLLNKDENNKRCQTYRAKNRTKINEYNQYYKNIFNANHPGYYLLYRKEYRKNNQERFNMWSKKYYKNGGKERAKKKYYNDKLTRLKICLRGKNILFI
ncbi:MAG: hypothetical protein IPJ03_22280 [Ignavibacteriales bacterium]|nr:hypothetical protein [Ignavibacteriales bacterium]